MADGAVAQERSSNGDTPRKVVWENVKARLVVEFRLILKQVRFFLLCAFIMVYLSTMVFRNLAFYRYQARPRLRDLGFDVLPDLENREFWSAIKDIPMTSSMWMMGLTCIVSILFGDGNKTPFAVNMLRRVLAMLSFGHCLRFMTYISTNMPGTTERCLPGHLDEMDPPKPTTMKEVFLTRIAMNPGNNCGDLLFSGHMLGIITPVLMVSKYGEKVFVDTGVFSMRLYKSVLIIIWSLIIMQAFLIIMMRNHYTADIVVAMYVTPLLWDYYNSVVQPNDCVLDDDIKPEEASISTNGNQV